MGYNPHEHRRTRPCSSGSGPALLRPRGVRAPLDGRYNLRQQLGGMAVSHLRARHLPRKTVGWSMANHLRTEVLLGALNMAIYNRRLAPTCAQLEQG